MDVTAAVPSVRGCFGYAPTDASHLVFGSFGESVPCFPAHRPPVPHKRAPGSRDSFPTFNQTRLIHNSHMPVQNTISMP